MGVIAVLLFSTGHLGSEFHVPFWIVLSAHAAIAAGTLMGGWRIVRTMGLRITKLEPSDGFAAEASSAAAILFATQVGIPVSTTQTIAGGIIGVGSTKRLSAVRWGVALNIVFAWFLTIPAAASVGIDFLHDGSVLNDGIHAAIGLTLLTAAMAAVILTPTFLAIKLLLDAGLSTGSAGCSDSGYY